MQARTRRGRPAPSQQLSFNEELFCTASASPHPDRPITAPSTSGAALQRLDSDGRGQACAPDAGQSAREVPAGLRNCLTALSTATALLVRHAPDSRIVGELSQVMLRQIQTLTQQIQRMEASSAKSDLAGP